MIQRSPACLKNYNLLQSKFPLAYAIFGPPFCVRTIPAIALADPYSLYPMPEVSRPDTAMRRFVECRPPQLVVNGQSPHSTFKKKRCGPTGQKNGEGMKRPDLK